MKAAAAGRMPRMFAKDRDDALRHTASHPEFAEPGTGTIYAGGGTEWFGPAVRSLVCRNDRLYAGVEPAGLFCSDDAGQSWTQITGMRDRLCDSSPGVRRHINIFVDGEHATFHTKLRLDAAVFIMTAINGD